MSKTGWLWFLIALCLALAGLPVFAADARPLIAVMPFDDGSIQHWWGGNWDVGKGISDMMVNELLASGQFRLVERERIATIVSEQDFGASGRVDARTAAKIGKIAGVKYMVMGKVTEFTVSDKGGAIGGPFGGLGVVQSTAKVAIDGRLIDTTTAEILVGARGAAEKSTTGVRINLSSLPRIAFGSANFQETLLGKATTEAVKGFCADLSAKFGSSVGGGSGVTAGLTGKVAAVAGGKVYLNIGSRDGASVGMVFVIGHVIEEVKDPDTGEVLDVVTEPICEIAITDVKEASCSGPITAGRAPAKGDIATQRY